MVRNRQSSRSPARAWLLAQTRNRRLKKEVQKRDQALLPFRLLPLHPVHVPRSNGPRAP